MERGSSKPWPVEIDRLLENRRKGIQADEFHFAEQRRNVELVKSYHHGNERDFYIIGGRSGRTKIKMTANYIGKYVRKKQNRLVTHSPMVKVLPKSGTDREDVKAATLANSVWKDAVSRHNINKLIKKLAFHYVTLGEAVVRIIWDPYKGEATGQGAIRQSDNPDEVNQYGIKLHKHYAIFNGDIDIEAVLPWNLIRPSSCDNIDKADWLCIDRVVPISTVKSWLAHDAEKYKQVSDNFGNIDYRVITYNSDNQYGIEKDSTIVSEMYFRPTPDYPQGLWFMFTDRVKMFWGELPFGIFPIRYAGFLEAPENARHYSIIRDVTSIQGEINACISKAMEHRVKVGDDKVLVPKGSDIEKGVVSGGIRYSYYNPIGTGGVPVVIQGRTGEQHMLQAESLVGILHDIFDEPDDQKPVAANVARPQAPRDADALLHASYKEKEYNAAFAEDFERLIVDTAKLLLKTARSYYTADRLVPMVGKKEYVNISEFTQHKHEDTIVVEPSSGNAMTVMGKQRAFTNILQYASKAIQPRDIGLIVKNMPLLNQEEAFRGLTQDYDIADNMILALNRGTPVEVNPMGEDVLFMIRSLISEIKDSGFLQKPFHVQQLYRQTLRQYQMIHAQQQAMEWELNKQMIPANGPLLPIGYYIPDPNSKTGRAKRAMIPKDSVEWLLQRLQAQGITHDKMQGIDIADRLAMQQMAGSMKALPQGPPQGPPGGM